jgi:hypothetical protein
MFGSANFYIFVTFIVMYISFSFNNCYFRCVDTFLYPLASNISWGLHQHFVMVVNNANLILTACSFASVRSVCDTPINVLKKINHRSRDQESIIILFTYIMKLSRRLRQQ